MSPDDQKRFPPTCVELKTGERATIRPLRTDDAERLGDFYETVPRRDFRFYAPHALDRVHAEGNAARALSPHEVVLVLEAPDGGIGGYAWYRWKSVEAGHSTFGICIRSDYQEKGAGSALMARLAEIALHVGPPVMQLTVQKANPRAVALYRKMGFRVVREGLRGESFGFPPEPQYWMERETRPGEGVRSARGECE